MRQLILMVMRLLANFSHGMCPFAGIISLAWWIHDARFNFKGPQRRAGDLALFSPDIEVVNPIVETRNRAAALCVASYPPPPPQ